MDVANGSFRAQRPVNGLNGGSLKPSIHAAKHTHAHSAASDGATSTRPSRPGLFVRTFSIAARLTTWYLILTILFRCPASLEDCDQSAPAICRTYFHTRNAVAPHVRPYYDAYAAPYADAARPYYRALDERVVSPARAYATRYGAPRLSQATAYGRAQWESTVQPQLLRYRALATSRYNQTLAPHVDHLSAVLAPYYDIALTNAHQTYYEFVVPSYRFMQPYAQQGYTSAHAFVARTALPAIVRAWNKASVFVDGAVWPHVRAIYVENVEPQLVKIGRRLGRYNGQQSTSHKTVHATTSPTGLSKTASSFTRPTPSGSPPSPANDLPTSSLVPLGDVGTGEAETGDAITPASPIGVAGDTPRSIVEPPEIDEQLESDNPTRREARLVVAEDLRHWQERYTKAADEGAAEMEQRIDEISKRMVRRNARVTGKDLLTQLQNAAVAELVTLRQDIQDLIGAFMYGSITLEEAQEQIASAVRRTGLEIKEKARALRTWHEEYEQAMQSAITQAAENHFKILAEIQDLALQSIGMKWAWMDGVTYSDWAKYHLLRSRFQEWQADLERQVVTHPGLEDAQLEGQAMEDEGMKVASAAAHELGRLKQVAAWKLTARDNSSEFDSETMREAAEEAEAAKGGTSPIEDAETLQVVDSTAGVDAAAQASAPNNEGLGAIKGTSTDRSEASGAAGEPPTSKEPPEAIPPPGGNLNSGTLPTTPATHVSIEDVSDVSEEKPGAQNHGVGKVSTTPTPSASLNLASTVMLDETVMLEANLSGNSPPTDESELQRTGEESAGIHDEGEELDAGEAEPETISMTVTSTATIRPVALGVAAQLVPSRQPVLDGDDEESFMESAASALDALRSHLPRSFVSAAQSAYSAALTQADSQYSTALAIVSAQISGTPAPVHEKMLASVASAYSNVKASAGLRLDDALKAASEQASALGPAVSSTSGRAAGLVSTAMPATTPVDWAHVEAVAAEQLSQGRSWAAEQYESARVAIGLATSTPSTPTGHMQRLLDNAQHNYYAAVGMAHERYGEFMAAASSALASMTATPTPTDLAGTASSVASVATESASSAASAVGEQLTAAWAAAISRASQHIYGAPTPTAWYEGAYNAMGGQAAAMTEAARGGAVAGQEKVAEQYSVASSLVSELLVGKEPGFQESVFSRLGALASTAAAPARSASDRLVSAVSTATEAVKEAVNYNRDEL